MHPKDAAGMANSVDPDQTAPSGSTLFAQNLRIRFLDTAIIIGLNLRLFFYMYY